MRLLLFSDVHCDAQAAANLVSKSKDVDVVIGAGDFGVQREAAKLAEIIRELAAIERPAVIVPGNGESLDELAAVCEGAGWAAHVLHGSGAEVDGVRFWGLGGGVPVTPFGAWSWDFTEEQASELLAGCPEDAMLVSHSPPKGVCDVDSGGASRGSDAVLAAIESKRPRLVACGHIHDSWESMEMVGPTKVVNAGPRGVIVEM